MSREFNKGYNIGFRLGGAIVNLIFQLFKGIFSLVRKKRVSVIMLILTGSFSGIAQTAQFHKGQSDYSLGIGLFSVVGSALQGEGFTTSTKLPPLSFAADFSVSDEVSIGGYLGIAKDEIYYTDYYFDDLDIGSVTHYLVGVRAQYHFEVSPNFDTYAGGMLGFNAAKLHFADAYDARVRGYTYNLMLGGRYHLNETFGFFMELGYGVSVVNLGITLKGGKAASNNTQDINNNTHQSKRIE